MGLEYQKHRSEAELLNIVQEAQKPYVVNSVDAVLAPRFAQEIAVQSVSFEYFEGPFGLTYSQFWPSEIGP